MKFADHIIAFNRHLRFADKLPSGIRVMNPFQENPESLAASELFYRKFYSDSRKRKLILGINPGRHGAGTTGIPFTDTKRLAEICGIPMEGKSTHEPSSVFVYSVIEKYGGAKKFYGDYFIHAVCPLGFLRLNSKGKWINANYYEKDIFHVARPFILSSLKKLLSFGVHTKTCFVLGKENAAHLHMLNEELNMFREIRVLEHPRYIEQYKKSQYKEYISKYLKAFAP